MDSLWTCPKCGRPFANRNQEHSCVIYTVDDHLSGKSPQVIALFERYVALVQQCGPFIFAPAKTRIGFQVRMIFSAITLTKEGLNAHVVLARRLEHPRFVKIESISARNHVHHFRIRDSAELDDEVFAWLRESYQVGEQRHLSK